MVKNTFSLVAIIFLLASCSSIKPLNFTSNKQVVSNTSASEEQSSFVSSRNNKPRFIDNITVSSEPSVAVSSSKESARPKSETVKGRGFSIDENRSVSGPNAVAIEGASALQLKYSILLNTEVEQLQNQVLLEKVDEWYGTRYRMGGKTKSGVDCSAFVQAVFLGAYAVALPRTAREQYKISRRISRTELKEGDLLFFNTTGGISHVGIYLQNNKFIHASASKGVTVSDLFDPYYLRRFMGAGRVEEKSAGFSIRN